MSLEEAICVLQTNPVILVQVVMVSPGTLLVKNENLESQSRTNESLGLCKNSHRNCTNRIFYRKQLQIDQLILASYEMYNINYFVSLVIFFGSGKPDEVTKSLKSLYD